VDTTIETKSAPVQHDEDVPIPERRLRMRGLPWTVLAWVVVAALASLYVATAGSYDVFVVTTIVIFAIAAVGQQWIIGGAGQVSLGGGAIMAIGAYATGWVQQQNALNAFPIPLIAGMIAGAVVGLVVGLPSVRLRGFYLVLATLALSFIVAFFGARYQVNHAAGLLVDPFTVFGKSSSDTHPLVAVGAVLLLLICLFIRQLYRNAPGSVWMVVRESETSALTMGISPIAWKLSAFVGSSAVTALAGGLYAYLLNSVNIEDFSLTLGVNLVLMVYIGGVDSLTGAVIGATLVQLLPIGLQNLSQHLSSGGAGGWLASNTSLVQSLIFGVFLVAVLLSDATGIVGVAQATGKRAVRMLKGTKTRSPKDGVESLGLEADATAAAQALPADLPSAVPADTSIASDERGLVVSDLRVVYRTGAVGISSVSFAVPSDRIVAIVGRNAAGKTSTVRAISGFPRDERVKVTGSVLFGGREICGLPPSKISKLGLAVVSERDKVFPTLSVLENLRAVGLTARDASTTVARVPELAHLRDRAAGLLSGGQRQLLALTVAVARRPKAILVDELSLGLAPIAITALMAEIKRIHDEDGTTVMLVDQALGALQATAEHVYVLENGLIVGEGSAEVLKSGRIHALVMGTDA
jgi:ABC-type branched-subunit amino acid transport system ATPase component/ABC-type branched-subunit amino acid transport system permease subunit